MNYGPFILGLLACAAYLQQSSAYMFLQRSSLKSSVQFDDRPLIRYLSFRLKIDALWRRHTRHTSNRPSFFAPSFNSTIVGKEMETVNKRTFYAFEGLRYGMAANISTRFKPPIPAGKFWDGDTFSGTEMGSPCPQGVRFGQSIITSGEEDCLFLNVYTPYLPSEKRKKLPVMVFFHGGSFTSGDTSMYLPTKLLDHEVMVVTIQYRLGILGFFTLNNQDAPGNAALYDMVEALRWIQKYIEDFGGDRNRVTLFGSSAGAASINYLLLIPSAKDLFHGAILQSGSALDVWAIDEKPRASLKIVANFLSCPIDDDKVLFDCVVQKDARDLVKAGINLVTRDRVNGLIGFRGVVPTIQTMQLSPNDDYELLVTRHPHDYFRDGNFAKIPIMAGSTKHEGSFVLGVYHSSYLEYHGLHDNATYMRENFVQDIVKSFDETIATPRLADVLRMKYCPGIDLADFDAAAPCFVDMLGAMYLKAGSWEMSNFHSCLSGRSTFYYSFDFENEDSLFSWIFGAPPFDPGVSHGDDLMYLFPMTQPMNTPEKKATMHRITKLWTNFAIYGDPTPDEETESLSNLGIPKWTPYRCNDPHYLLMQNNFTIGNDFTERWTISVDELRKNIKTYLKYIRN